MMKMSEQIDVRRKGKKTIFKFFFIWKMKWEKHITYDMQIIGLLILISLIGLIFVYIYGLFWSIFQQINLFMLEWSILKTFSMLKL